MRQVKKINLIRRVKEISNKKSLSHIGSNLTAVGIIDNIYKQMQDGDIFVLSAGHMGLALYCVIEKYYGIDAYGLYDKNGTHPTRDINDKIHVTSGSLGMGLGIASGMAMANKNINVYCLISDGEMFEGSIYECSTFVNKYNIENLKIYMNYNGLSAYDTINKGQVAVVKKMFGKNLKICKTDVKKFGFKGLDAHYEKRIF